MALITCFTSTYNELYIVGPVSIALLLAVAGEFLLLRRLMLQRLVGATGDTAGALTELTEIVALFTAVAFESIFVP